MGSHQSQKMKETDWLTPPEILKALGPFDLDPCAPMNRPWDMAKHHFTPNDNGLYQKWFGRVWCNPPYNSFTSKWLSKLYNHGNGIALIFARTETEIFFTTVWKCADAILFIKGRLHFYNLDGVRAKQNAGAPSALVAYGNENAERLRNSGIAGIFINLKTEGIAHIESNKGYENSN